MPHNNRREGPIYNWNLSKALRRELNSIGKRGPNEREIGYFNAIDEKAKKAHEQNLAETQKRLDRAAALGL